MHKQSKIFLPNSNQGPNQRTYICTFLSYSFPQYGLYSQTQWIMMLLLKIQSSLFCVVKSYCFPVCIIFSPTWQYPMSLLLWASAVSTLVNGRRLQLGSAGQSWKWSENGVKIPRIQKTCRLEKYWFLIPLWSVFSI